MLNQTMLKINGRRYIVEKPERFNRTEGWYSCMALDERTGFQLQIWEYCGKQDLLEKAWEKAEKLARLKLPGMPLIYDAIVENEKLFLVIDKVEGRSFWEYPSLRRVLAADLPVVVEYGRGLCSILSRLHPQFPHRGLLPKNIVIVGNKIALTDFGFAFMPAGYESGQLPYRAPEQHKAGGEVGPWTDIYSFGLIWGEMLAGRRLIWHRRDQRDWPEIPGELKEIIMHCTEESAANRPKSIEEVKHRLSEWLLFAKGERSLITPVRLANESKARPTEYNALPQAVYSMLGAAGQKMRCLAVKRMIWALIVPLLLLQPVLISELRQLNRPLPITETAAAQSGPDSGRQASLGELTGIWQAFAELAVAYKNAKVPGDPEKTARNFRYVEHKADLAHAGMRGVIIADPNLAETLMLEVEMFDELKIAAALFADYLEGKRTTTPITDWVEESDKHYRQALALQTRIGVKLGYPAGVQ